uniref:Uncharacterized protein n=1 Tax=Arundo donax TaxID=35708 RepID=A0A0A9E6K8_ARUDO
MAPRRREQQHLARLCDLVAASLLAEASGRPLSLFSGYLTPL